MATYIQGLTDYIPQIQPFRPDYNFLGNVLQANQSRYDTNYKALNDQYSTLLNSPMMRDDNNKQREEFFKIINQDIKKISAMDLSLQKNVDNATRVFDSFYKNKYMVDDMVKTKKLQSEIDRGMSYKNCHDPKKCNGEFWQEGIDYLNYKAKEYQTASREETLGLDIGTYTPFYNWKKEALQLAKDQDISVTIDHSNGKYIVHDKNGKLVQGGLYQVYSEVYGDDPRVKGNYDVESYVARNRYIDNNAEKFGSRDLAERSWIESALKTGNTAIYKQKEDIERANNEVSARLAKLNEKAKTIGLTPEEKDIRDGLPDVKAKLVASRDKLTASANALKEYNQEIKQLRLQADMGYSHYLMDRDITDMAVAASYRDVQHTMKEDQYGLSAFQSKLRREENDQLFQQDMKKIGARLNAELTVEQYKAALENGMIDGESGLASGKGGDIGGTPIPASTSGTGKLDLEDNPEAFYNMNRDAVLKRQQEGKTNSADFLYQAFLTAKKAAKDPARNPGALSYLESHYGKDWNKINNLETLLKAGAKKGTVVDLFNSTVSYLNQDKNPNGDLQWAQSLMSSNAKNIANISIQNQSAEGLLKKHAESNRRIANELKALSKPGERFYADADLLVGENGIALLSEEMPSEFSRRFMQRYNMFTGSGYKAAQKAYDTLRDKFLDKYNHSKEVSLQQGVGLDGGGHLTATAMRYSAIDATRYMSPYLHKARLFADAAVDNAGKVQFTTGNPDAKNMDDLTKEEQAALSNFFKVFQNDIRSKWGKTDGERPIFSMTEFPIAGNDPDKAGVKFDISPEYLKRFVGKEKEKGILWSLRDKLADGISYVYDRKEISTPTTTGIQASAYEDLIKTQGVKYDVPNAGSIELSYDASNGRIMLEQQYVRHDPMTGRKYTDYKPPIALPLDTKLDENYHETVLNQLEQLRQSNEQFDAMVANFYRDK